MDTTSVAVGTGLVVVIGQWSEGGTVTPRIVMGSAMLAVALAAISAANAELGGKFALLILVGAIFRYAMSIFTKTGIVAAPKTGAKK